MHVFERILPFQDFLAHKRLSHKKIGFIPTMGALHAGHISLISASKAENDITVCSIYINPEQFNNKTDLINYPKVLHKDKIKLEQAGCDVLFCPSDEEMYPEKPTIKMNFGSLEETMEGKYRKGHFNGVVIVVSKFFNIVHPALAYFGQKDLQQFLIIKQLVRDFSFNIKLKCQPIVREVDGLAMSSRNSRLTPEEREKAGSLYKGLILGKEYLLKTGNVADTKMEVHNYLSAILGIHVEYFEIVDSENLLQIEDLDVYRQVALCIAAYVGTIRLIDNMLLY